MRLAHNPGFLSDETIIESFVVRRREYEAVLEVLRENTGPANQHLLVVGQRGMGKSTLLRRVAAEIRRDAVLQKRWFPVLFGEEAYGVATAGELWLEALLHLADESGEARWREAYEAIREERDEQRLATRALARLVDFAEERDARLLLGVENLHMLLGDQLNDEAGWAIRKVLQTQPRIMLLGTAVAHFSALDEPKRPFYELFREITLDPLDQAECQQVWNAAAEREDSLLQARAVQILTGGNPRLIALLGGFARDRSFQSLMDDLVALVDDHTPYFKANVEALPPKERKVFVTLADIWAPATSRQVADRARISINEVSSLLRRLLDRGAVRVAYQVGRVRFYEVAERLYNIYHLMRRRGSPEHSRVRALIEFMGETYSDSQLHRITHKLWSEPLSEHLHRDREQLLSGLKDRVVRRMEFSRESNPPQLAEDLASAWTHIADNDHGEAVRVALEVVERDPDWGPGWQVLSAACLFAGEFEQMLDAHRAAIQRVPNSLKYSAALAIRLYGLDLTESRAEFARARALYDATDQSPTSEFVNLAIEFEPWSEARPVLQRYLAEPRPWNELQITAGRFVLEVAIRRAAEQRALAELVELLDQHSDLTWLEPYRVAVAAAEGRAPEVATELRAVAEDLLSKILDGSPGG